MTAYYEENLLKKSEFPIHYHYDTVHNTGCPNEPHFHENLELLYATHGCTCISIGNTDIIAKKNDLIVVPSNAIHSTANQDVHSRYHVLIIEKTYLHSIGFNIKNTSFKLPINDIHVDKLMNEIIYCLYSKNGHFNHARAISKVIELMIYIFENFESKSETDVTPKNFDIIQKVFDYVDKNYSKHIYIQDIADYLGFSLSYFEQIFNENVNMSVMSYINYVRCKKAQELIKTEKYLLKEIPDMCGFNDYSYFSKVFKRYIGVLPSKCNN